MGFVYVVSDGVKTKIGMTSNPRERIPQIRRELFRGVNEISISTHETLLFKHVERIAISELSSKFQRVCCEYKNEVFFASFDDVVLAVNDSIMKAEENELKRIERINRSSSYVRIPRYMRRRNYKKA